MGVSSLLSILCAAMSSTDVGDAHSTCKQATYVDQGLYEERMLAVYICRL